ncbi:hypothetical protein BDQ12DRAFT_686863 [Crucibulum laeve]|uniref:Uncharacterized protein n=1 Tax=Crucibulum laeve TaxID=68775 RepID=A0A5C3LWD5_9AGAR|nr:hypothetical protein BDQ12DRAFT_686863 [Crucibulum laeve]
MTTDICFLSVQVNFLLLLLYHRFFFLVFLIIPSFLVFLRFKVAVATCLIFDYCNRRPYFVFLHIQPCILVRSSWT